MSPQPSAPLVPHSIIQLAQGRRAMLQLFAVAMILSWGSKWGHPVPFLGHSAPPWGPGWPTVATFNCSGFSFPSPSA